MGPKRKKQCSEVEESKSRKKTPQSKLAPSFNKNESTMSVLKNVAIESLNTVQTRRSLRVVNYAEKEDEDVVIKTPKRALCLSSSSGDSDFEAETKSNVGKFVTKQIPKSMEKYSKKPVNSKEVKTILPAKENKSGKDTLGSEESEAKFNLVQNISSSKTLRIVKNQYTIKNSTKSDNIPCYGFADAFKYREIDVSSDESDDFPLSRPRSISKAKISDIKQSDCNAMQTTNHSAKSMLNEESDDLAQVKKETEVKVESNSDSDFEITPKCLKKSRKTLQLKTKREQQSKRTFDQILENNTSNQPKRARKSKKDSVGRACSTTKVVENMQVTKVPDVIVERVKESDSSSESDWEDVAEGETEANLDDYKPLIPAEGVQITVEGPSFNKRRERKSFDVLDFIRLQINRERKDIQLAMHQVHLLCLLAHGLHVNEILSSSTFGDITLSFVPMEFTKLGKSKKVDVELIQKVQGWFNQVFVVVKDIEVPGSNIRAKLCHGLEHQTVSDASTYNVLFVGVARALKLEVRLCMSLYPLSFKAKDLLKKSKLGNSSSCTPKQNNKNETKQEVSQKKQSQKSQIQKSKTKAVSLDKASVKESKTTKIEKVEDKDLKRTPRRSVSKAKYKICSDDDDDDSDMDFVPEGNNSDDGDEKSTKRRNKASTSKVKKAQPRNRKILSSDSEDSVVEIKHKKGIECWCEIYSKVEQRWIAVDCYNETVDKPYEIEKHASQPVTYIVAFDSKGCIKDVTKRYCSDWMTHTRKLRADPEWWEETLDPFLPPENKQSKKENEELEHVLNQKPMPTKITDFKNHPLYALERHLLKFEALYPPDAPSLGFIRKEPVYARECVHKLHSRETWVKNARVVKVGEVPYKIVTARPKWDRMAGVMKSDLPLELFGFWQTEAYKPPVAKDGKVPRNEYGNVELFQPSMLPIGTVHLQIPGLNRVAKKLDVDCSPAVVGFDGHKGSIHPVFDGFVICAEHKDAVLAAWEEEQHNIRKREKEKREKRIYGNWKKLIKGLLLREKIKAKYDTK